jgi:DHA2 family multidrug resistance protein
MVPLTRDWDFDELLWPQILRGVSLMFCIIPINNLALGTLTPAQVKSGSGLYNLMRNLGGAVGLAAINTLLNNRFDLHITRLHETVTWANTRALAWLDAVQHRMGGLANPDVAALKQLAQMVRGQAYVMAFSDVFAAVTVAFLLMVPLLVIVRRPAGGAAAEAH